MYKGLEFPFGEPVLFRIAGNIAGGNMQSRFFPGFYLGKMLTTGEARVMHETGEVYRTRAADLKPRPHKVKMTDFDVLKGTPHDPSGSLHEMVAPPRPTDLSDTITNDNRPAFIRAPKSFSIDRKLVRELGGTPNCRQCIAMETGGPLTGQHTTECRERMRREMETRPEYAERIQADLDRRVRFFEDHIGADETTTGSTERTSAAAAEPTERGSDASTAGPRVAKQRGTRDIEVVPQLPTHSGIPGPEGDGSREEDKPQDDDMGIPQATEDTVDQTTMTTGEEQDKPMESASPAEQPQEEKTTQRAVVAAARTSTTKQQRGEQTMSHKG